MGMAMSADDLVGKVQDKARAAYEGLTGKNEAIGDADPDIEYEPAPDTKVMQDGMVVLSEDQAADADLEDADVDDG
jgi:hypothetical protein